MFWVFCQALLKWATKQTVVCTIIFIVEGWGNRGNRLLGGATAPRHQVSQVHTCLRDRLQRRGRGAPLPTGILVRGSGCLSSPAFPHQLTKFHSKLGNTRRDPGTFALRYFFSYRTHLVTVGVLLASNLPF